MKESIKKQNKDEIFIVTGALGHLGSTIIRDLLNMGKKVRGFDLKKVRFNNLDKEIDMIYGDITNYNDVEKLFSVSQKNIYVIHCAAIVTISSFPNKKVYDVNVNGVKNIVNSSIKHHVKRFIYVSSVHAIPESEKGTIQKEINHFNPDLVKGLYAKTKAEASEYVLQSTKKGLNASIVHPSGIIGPYDYGNGHLTRLFIDYLNNKLTAITKGGYNFVDVRDVSKGTIDALLYGKNGKCYLLTNKYYTLEELITMVSKITNKKPIKTILPFWFVKTIAFFAEIYYMIRKIPPLFTNYSLYTLKANSLFTHELATKELGYKPRSMEETIKDTIDFILEHDLK